MNFQPECMRPLYLTSTKPLLLYKLNYTLHSPQTLALVIYINASGNLGGRFLKSPLFRSVLKRLKSCYTIALRLLARRVYSNFFQLMLHKKPSNCLRLRGVIAREPLQNAFELFFCLSLSAKHERRFRRRRRCTRTQSVNLVRDALAHLCIMIYKFQRWCITFFKKRLVFKSSLSPPRSQALQNYGHA